MLLSLRVGNAIVVARPLKPDDYTVLNVLLFLSMVGIAGIACLPLHWLKPLDKSEAVTKGCCDVFCNWLMAKKYLPARLIAFGSTCIYLSFFGSGTAFVSFVENTIPIGALGHSYLAEVGFWQGVSTLCAICFGFLGMHLVEAQSSRCQLNLTLSFVYITMQALATIFVVPLGCLLDAAGPDLSLVWNSICMCLLHALVIFFHSRDILAANVIYGLFNVLLWTMSAAPFLLRVLPGHANLSRDLAFFVLCPGAVAYILVMPITGLLHLHGDVENVVDGSADQFSKDGYLQVFIVLGGCQFCAALLACAASAYSQHLRTVHRELV